MQNREAKRRLKEKREKKKKKKKKKYLLLRLKSALSVETLEDPETPSQNIITSTQARFKINDLVNIAPATGKRRYRSQTTRRWGNVVKDPVGAEGKWMYASSIKSAGRGTADDFDEGT